MSREAPRARREKAGSDTLQAVAERSLEGVVQPLERAVALVPFGSRVLLAGMPDPLQLLPRLVRDRDCEVHAFALSGEEAAAWAGLVPTHRQGDLPEVDVVLCRGVAAETPAPAALLAALPRRRVLMVEDNQAHVSRWLPAASTARRRLVSLEQALLLAEAAGFVVTDEHVCRSLPECLPRGRAWMETIELAAAQEPDVLGWVLELSPGPVEPHVDSADANADDVHLQRDGQLMLASYRHALARLRAQVDAEEDQALSELREWQAELRRQARLEGLVYGRARRARRIAGRIVRGLRGQAP